MKNKRIIFWNLKKKNLDGIDPDARYVIFGDDRVDLTLFKIKPIIVRCHGALIEDLEENKVIFTKDLSKKKIDSVKDYSKKYNVIYHENKINNKVYEIQLETTNYYRMLVMPSFIKNEYTGIATVYDYPFTLDKKTYQNDIISNDVSILSAILCIINYLKLQSNDILDLVNVSYLLIEVIMNQGYCMTDNKLKINNSSLLMKKGANLI